MKKETLSALFLIVLVLIVCLAPFRGALVSEESAVRALEVQGFSGIRVTEHAYFLLGLRGGDENDAARFTAEAKNPAGKDVTVYVFVGWPFKGATIRTP